MSKIMAIIANDPGQAAGGAPIFIARDEQEQKRLAFALEKMLDAAAHDLKNGMIVLVDHSDSE